MFPDRMFLDTWTEAADASIHLVQYSISSSEASGCTQLWFILQLIGGRYNTVLFWHKYNALVAHTFTHFSRGLLVRHCRVLLEKEVLPDYL